MRASLLTLNSARARARHGKFAIGPPAVCPPAVCPPDHLIRPPRTECNVIMARSPLREPWPRSHHVAVSAGSKLLIWGGMDWRGLIEATTVEEFDLLSTAWQEPRKLCGESLPDGFHKMAVAWDETKAYMFGGKDIGETRYNDLYEVDLTSLECKKIQPAAGSAPPPSPRSSSSMACVGRQLVVYGGFDGEEGSDELHVFDLDTSMSNYRHYPLVYIPAPNSHVHVYH